MLAKQLFAVLLEDSIERDLDLLTKDYPIHPNSYVSALKKRFLDKCAAQFPSVKPVIPKTNWITYTLDQIKELGEKYNPARNFVSQSAMRSSGQDDTQRQIDLEKEFWVLIAWEPTDDPPYFKLQCCNKPYPTTAPRIQLQYNGVPITVPISPSYDAEEGLLDVEITQALPANENMQLRMAPNNKDSTELVIDVCSIA